VAMGFQRSDALSRQLFASVRARVGRPLSLALAGLGVGVIAIAVPEVLGDGADLPGIDGHRQPIQAILDGQYGTEWSAVPILLALLVAKLVATSLSTGSGSAVGIFAPSLFLGAALGGAFGVASFQLFGESSADVGAFALVGMAAVFAAVARAPLTSVLIVFELTGSYDLVLPLMLAVGIAMFTAELGRSESIYLEQLRERGVVYGTGEDLDVLQTVEVGEVMTRNHPTLPVDLSHDEARARLDASGSHGAAVVDRDGRLVGVLTRADLDRPGRTVGELCTRQVLTVTPDDPVFVGVRRMASLQVGRLPVIDPTDRRVVGMLRRGDVVRAYQRGISRSLGSQQRSEASRLRDLAGVRFVEVVIDAQAAIVGTQVKDVPWPPRTVVASVRRAGEVVVPDGSTRMEADDELVVLTAEPDAVRRLVVADAAPGAGELGDELG
jgi:chloride channel protein, CIC family